MREQRGFTLIEIIMVVVILGVLSAFAVPKFANLVGESKSAVRDGVVGALKSAMSITKSACLVRSNECDLAAVSSVTIQGQSVVMRYGYPAVNVTFTGIRSVVNIDVPATNTSKAITYTVDTDCTVIYTEADDTVTPAIISGDDTCGG